MKNKYYITVICFICVLLLSLTGCGAVSQANINAFFDENYKTKTSESGVLAENEKFSLNWDNEFRRIFIIEKSSGKIWSNLPDELFETRYDEDGDEITNNPNLETPFIMEYYDAASMKSKKINAYTATVKKGKYSFEKIENGVEITYFFDQIQIAIPVRFVLYNDYFTISIDSSKIKENDNKVRSITLMPFLCSVKNNDNGYLFIPSGSGALIYASDENEVSTYLSAPVYGEDLQKYPKQRLKASNTEKVKLPIFGACDSDGKGTMGIISSGAESSNIYVDYGNRSIGYSTVAVEFIVRDYQNATANVNSGKWETQVYAENAVSSVLSVDYYSLYGDTNNYVSMAEIYRQYLIENYGMTQTSNETLLNINFLGGVKIDKNILGIPYKEMFSTTPVEDAQKITEELSKNIPAMKVNLMGYGDEGLQIGKIAGGYSINNKIGNVSDLKSFIKWAKNTNVDLFMEFGIASFSKSGKGLSTLLSRDVALGVNFRAAQQFDYHVGNKSVREDSFSYYLVKRELIPQISEKVILKSNDFNLNGISLDLVANSVYSDYRNQKYYCSGNFAEDIYSVIKNMKKQGKNVLVSSANDYAAVIADCIFDAPVSSNKEVIFTCDIPFYSIVFKGYVPMTASSLNLSIDDEVLLHCAETGSGLLYTVSNEYNEKLRGVTPDVFYATDFKDIKDDMLKQVSDYEEYFETVKNASIVDYEILDNGLRKTIFSSGTIVYVNFSDGVINSPQGQVPAMSFIYSK